MVHASKSPGIWMVFSFIWILSNLKKKITLSIKTCLSSSLSLLHPWANISILHTCNALRRENILIFSNSEVNLNTLRLGYPWQSSREFQNPLNSVLNRNYRERMIAFYHILKVACGPPKVKILQVVFTVIRRAKGMHLLWCRDGVWRSREAYFLRLSTAVW